LKTSFGASWLLLFVCSAFVFFFGLLCLLHKFSIYSCALQWVLQQVVPWVSKILDCHYRDGRNKTFAVGSIHPTAELVSHIQHVDWSTLIPTTSLGVGNVCVDVPYQRTSFTSAPAAILRPASKKYSTLVLGCFRV